MGFDGARAEFEVAGDLLAGAAGHQVLRHFALARRELAGDAAARGNVLEHPDRMGEGPRAVQRAAHHVAPEQRAVAPFHDALVAVRALVLHHRQAEPADVEVLVLRRIERRQGLPRQFLRRIAEHLAERGIAQDDDAFLGDAHPHGGQVERQPQGVHGLGLAGLGHAPIVRRVRRSPIGNYAQWDRAIPAARTPTGSAARTRAAPRCRCGTSSAAARAAARPLSPARVRPAA
jgi:GNAT superfamily N-acetyltransferase